MALLCPSLSESISALSVFYLIVSSFLAAYIIEKVKLKKRKVIIILVGIYLKRENPVQYQQGLERKREIFAKGRQ